MRDYAKLNLKVERHKRRKRSFLLGFGIFALAVFTFVLGFLVGQEIQNSAGLSRAGEKEETLQTTMATVSPPPSAPPPVITSGKKNLPAAERTPPVVSREATAQTVSTPRLPASSPLSTEKTEPSLQTNAPTAPVPEVTVEPPAVDSADTYTLQVAAFREKERAQRLLRDLEEKGYKPYIVATDNSRNESWYLVRIGRFRNAETARQYAQNLEAKEKISALVWKVTPER